MWLRGIASSFYDQASKTVAQKYGDGLRLSVRPFVSAQCVAPLLTALFVTLSILASTPAAWFAGIHARRLCGVMG